MSNIYAGTGKFYMGTHALWPDAESGSIVAKVEQEAIDVASGFYGRMASVQGGAMVSIDTTPYADWSLLPVLFPAYLGVSIALTPTAQTGLVAIGTQPHGAADVPGKIWTPDGRLYSFPRVGIIQHPGIHLGVDKSFFGPVKLAAIIATGKKMGDAGAFYTLTATGATDPGGSFTLTVPQGAWTGVWGTVAGFGGGTGDSPIEAEDEWVISCEAKYTPRPVQKLIRCYTLDSVKFMAKCRPFGPTQAQLDSAIGLNNGRLLGSQIANSTTAHDLVLSGPASHVITLTSADVVGAGFEFGGTKLGNGEIGFVNTMQFTGGVPQPLLTFSA